MIIKDIEDLINLIDITLTEDDKRSIALDSIIETAKSYGDEFPICVGYDGILTDGAFEALMNKLGVIIDWKASEGYNSKFITLSKDNFFIILPLIEIKNNNSDNPDYYCLPNKMMSYL